MSRLLRLGLAWTFCLVWFVGGTFLAVYLAKWIGGWVGPVIGVIVLGACYGAEPVFRRVDHLISP